MTIVVNHLISACVIGVMTLVAQQAGAASPRCDQEIESAMNTVAKIREEWPIRERDFLTDYVDRVMWQIVRKSKFGNERWRTFVVRNLSANGFSIGDGNIYINEGAILRANTESQLAAVIAHEIGHEILRHFCRPRKESSTWDWHLFSDRPRPPVSAKSNKLGSIHQLIDPSKELEADARALDLLSAAGYDPHAMLEVAQRVAADDDDPNRFGERRVRELKRRLALTRRVEVRDSPDFLFVKSQLQQTLE